VGFLCAPGYCWLSECAPPAVRLVEAAFVFDDPRAEGRPVYFADLVVSARSRVRRLEDLAGSRWTYNDRASLSGWFSVLEELQSRGLGDAFFSEVSCSGSHRRSLEMVMRGEADCAAIDSNYLLLMRRRDPLLAASVRVIESLGPHAIQPVVARAGLAPDLHEAITRALLGMHRHARWGDLLRHHGVLRFDAVGESDYAAERRALRRCETQIPR
jgi:phosphonate transport system substrate-binding protein